MATAKSLEDFLKKHRGLTNSQSAKTLSEYMNSSGIRPMENYAKAVRSAMTERVSNGGKYGTRAEKIGRNGLSNSGYSEHLEEMAEAKKQSEISDAKERMDREYIDAQGEFEKYLQKYRTTQDSKMQDLEGQLVKFGIMRLDETYAIGIDYGLSPEDAATVSATVYRTLRDQTFDKCIQAAQNSYMDENGLRSYGERMGLLPGDVERLIHEAGRFLKKDRGGYSAYLENISDT